MFSNKTPRIAVNLDYTDTREHEGTERDTPSHGFVICHSH